MISRMYLDIFFKNKLLVILKIIFFRVVAHNSLIKLNWIFEIDDAQSNKMVLLVVGDNQSYVVSSCHIIQGTKREACTQTTEGVDLLIILKTVIIEFNLTVNFVIDCREMIKRSFSVKVNNKMECFGFNSTILTVTDQQVSSNLIFFIRRQGLNLG